MSPIGLILFADNGFIARLTEANGDAVNCYWSPNCHGYTFEWEDGTVLDYPTSPSWWPTSINKQGVYMDNGVSEDNWMCTKMWGWHGFLDGRIYYTISFRNLIVPLLDQF